MVTETKYLLESSTLVGESANADGTWKIRVISEGKGSSGTYTKELLENHFHAFDNVLSFKNHPNWYEGPQVRDFTMIAGELKGETWIETDERGLTAVYGNYLPDPEYRDKLERYKSKLGLSIYIEGSGYEDPDTGEFIVDWFNPEDPYASVDVVIAPGARGKFFESARVELDKMYSRNRESKPDANTSAQEPKERKSRMDEADLKEMKAALAGISEALTALVSDKKAKESQDAQVTADETAIQEGVAKVTSALDAIESARDELFPSQVESLRAEAKLGKDIAPLIEDAKKVKADALADAERITEGAGRDITADPKKSRFGAWA